MNLDNLNYVILLCEDLVQMKAFYQEVLGFPIARDWGDWIELCAGRVLLTLRRRGRPYDGPTAYGSAGVQLAFRVEREEMNACYTELLLKQVEILEPPRDWDYDHRTLFFKDPDGNILEIYAEI
jgi:lactoylglutathione lyase